MPRTITIDSINVTQIRLVKDSTGQFQVYAEYQLKSGTQQIQANYQEITSRLSPTRKAAAQAVLDAITQDLAALELA